MKNKKNKIFLSDLWYKNDIKKRIDEKLKQVYNERKKL